MRNRLIVLITAVLAILGLVVPATAVGASPAGEVVTAEAAAQGQAMFDDLVASVGAVDGSVQSAALVDWLVANLGVAVPLLCSLVPEILPGLAGLAATACGLINAVLPVVVSLLPVLLPILAVVILPLCGVVTTVLPSLATVINLVCPFIANLLAPPAPTTTTTVAP